MQAPETSYKIVLIGAGNVATHLGKRLQKKGHEILQVISKTDKSGRELSLLFNIPFASDLKKINTGADMYILCVPDAEIERIAASLKLPNKLVLHTSGSIGMDVLKTISNNAGVLYPLYSFSKQVKVSFSSVPFLVEGSNKQTLQVVTQFATSMGKNVTPVNSTERQKIHLSAVFVNNFSNFLYAQAYDYLKKEKQNHFHLLQPLIKQTVKKIKTQPPSQVQTGPARRNDTVTLKKHMELLEKYPDQKQVYKLLTALIKKQYHG